MIFWKVQVKFDINKLDWSREGKPPQFVITTQTCFATCAFLNVGLHSLPRWSLQFGGDVRYIPCPLRVEMLVHRRAEGDIYIIILNLTLIDP